MSKKQSSHEINVNAEEQALFRSAVKNTKPITQDKHLLKKEQVKKHSAPTQQNNHQPGIDYCQLSPADWLQPEDHSDFHKDNLQYKTLRKLRRGQFPIEASLDLHHCTTNEALERVEHFFSMCQQQQQRWLCIIHGKGLYAKEGRSILKAVLNKWLRDHAKVLAFCSAKPKDGGTGALYVLIKLGNPSL